MIGAIRRLGPWQRSEHLGGGGYAQAYLSRSESMPGQAAALKVYDDPTYANTFLREIAALTAIAGCPGTPALLDWGRDADGRLCIVTEFAPGTRLDKLVKTDGPLSEDRVETIVRQLLATLACAHAAGIVHKDIKASNVLVADTGATLLDWGVAEQLGDGHAEDIRAKQDIVAPECYFGRHTFATDAYSLGWLVIFAFSGQLPYRFGIIADLDYRVAAHCLERPELPASLPVKWRPLVSRWLSKDPAQRPLDAELDRLFAVAGTDVLFDPSLIDSRNLGRSASYLRQAAEANIPYAQHELGRRLFKEPGREDEARYWLERASNAGYARSTFLLGRRSGDPAEQGALFERAARSGHPGAAYYLARQLLAAGAEATAREWLERAANHGHMRAQYDYAHLIEASRPEIAMGYYQAAAERGHEKAAAWLTR